MNLPDSVVITGCDRFPSCNGFGCAPFSSDEQERSATLLAKTADALDRAI